ncbi:MAG: hypothetical protein AB1394_12075 [Bacteroidota bacterium]
MRTSRQKVLLLLRIALLLTAPSMLSVTTKIRNTWQYRWGDSPINLDEKLEWIVETNADSLWTSIGKPADILTEQSEIDLWVRIRLDEKHNKYTAVFIKPKFVYKNSVRLKDIFLKPKFQFT